MQKELILEHDMPGIAYLRQYKIGKYQVKEYTDSVNGKITAHFEGPLDIHHFEGEFAVRFIRDIYEDEFDSLIANLQEAKEVIKVYKEG